MDGLGRVADQAMTSDPGWQPVTVKPWLRPIPEVNRIAIPALS